LFRHRRSCRVFPVSRGQFQISFRPAGSDRSFPFDFRNGRPKPCGNFQPPPSPSPRALPIVPGTPKPAFPSMHFNLLYDPEFRLGNSPPLFKGALPLPTESYFESDFFFVCLRDRPLFVRDNLVKMTRRFLAETGRHAF